MDLSKKGFPPIQHIIKEYGLFANKKLGQNFLFDQNITDKIARSAGDIKNKTVIEIGPGPGLLTRSLLQTGVKKLIAIEKDKRCVEALQSYLLPYYKNNLIIKEQDALQESLYSGLKDKYFLVANLPYNISTKLLFLWFNQLEKFESLTLMFQKEVAQRIMAKPNTKSYNWLSIKSQLLCTVKHNFDISPTAFFPKPKVISSVITLTPKTSLTKEVNLQALEKICKTVFNTRRKMLKVSLKKIIQNPEKLLDKAEINANARPEALSIEEFCNLTKNYEKMI